MGQGELNRLNTPVIRFIRAMQVAPIIRWGQPRCFGEEFDKQTGQILAMNPPVPTEVGDLFLGLGRSHRMHDHAAHVPRWMPARYLFFLWIEEMCGIEFK